MNPDSKELLNKATFFWNSLTEQAVKVGETISATTSEATKTVINTTAQVVQLDQQASMNQSFDLAAIPEADRIAFYGALFAIAFADGSPDKEELELIFGMMDLEGVSEAAKCQVQSYIIEPPSLQMCLKTLSKADEKLRFSLMVNLVETAWANDELDAREEEALKLAQQELYVTNEQLAAIKTFIQKVREIRLRGLDDNQAENAIKGAAAGLSAVGVPIAAVYFSGSVIGLSAAGITSGLAALGLGFGMVPGIGIAVLVGTGIFLGVANVLDLGGDRAKEEEKQKQIRKAQLVIENLQATINELVSRIAGLQEKAAIADANQEAILKLTERLRYLKQLIEKKQVSQQA